MMRARMSLASARLPFRPPRCSKFGSRSMRCTMGIKKARVLPVPVLACAITSAPSRHSLMVIRWTSVIVCIPMRLTIVSITFGLMMPCSASSSNLVSSGGVSGAGWAAVACCCNLEKETKDLAGTGNLEVYGTILCHCGEAVARRGEWVEEAHDWRARKRACRPRVTASIAKSRVKSTRRKKRSEGVAQSGKGKELARSERSRCASKKAASGIFLLRHRKGTTLGALGGELQLHTKETVMTMLISLMREWYLIPLELDTGAQ